MEPDRFRLIRSLFGEMDDLCQERRRTFTGWVARNVEPADFLATMRRNLRATRERTETLEKLIAWDDTSPESPPRT